MFLSNNIASATYGGIKIQSINRYNIDVSEEIVNAFAYDHGITDVCTFLVLTDAFNRLQSKAIIYTNVENLRTFDTLEETQTPEVKAELEIINNNVEWLWGDVTSGGGAFLCKDEISGRVCFGVYYGLIFYNDTQKYSFAFAIDRFNTLQNFNMRSVAVVFRGSDSDFSFPNLGLCCAPYQTMPVYDLDTNDLYTAKYNPIAGVSLLSTAMNNPQWSDDYSIFNPFEFTPMPCRCWECTTATVPFYTNCTLISGGWTAGLEYENEDGDDPSAPAGGDGDYPKNSDPKGFADPTGMEVNAINSGLVTLYNPTQQAVASLNNYLFSGSITEAISNQLKRLISDPYDYLIFLAMCHFKPTNNISGDTIGFCGIDTNIGAIKITDPIVDIGPYTRYIGYNSESFTDFNPFTKARIYLPYIGYESINVDDVVGCNIQIMYHIDLLTGACVCELKSERNARVANKDSALDRGGLVFYNWTGNVYQMIPLSSNDFRGLFQSALQVGAGVASVLAGNPAGLGAIASGVMSQKSSVSSQGRASTSYGYMSSQTPNIILETSLDAMPKPYFQDFEGYPSNIYIQIGKTHGYVEADPETVWGDSITYTSGDITITAFDNEIAEIKDLFDKGVYVNV